ncbi:MAG: glutaredoxin family protein [Nitrososphaerota archaeon]|nr:glutaredoxin family protein [Nitrososphaerota archaeon]
MPETIETPDVIIFRKEGCHLCEAVETEIRSMKGIKANPVTVNIDGNPALQEKYWARVPVVIVDGREIFEAKTMDLEGEWRKQLLSLLRGT